MDKVERITWALLGEMSWMFIFVVEIYLKVKKCITHHTDAQHVWAQTIDHFHPNTLYG